MTRRELISAPAALCLGGAPDPFYSYFSSILEGFLRNARRTTSTFAACDYPDGTRLPYALTRSGKTYCSVSRMLPSLAAYIAGGHAPPSLLRVVTSIFESAFDPRHPDYWLPSPADKADLRQVESSIVAWSWFLLKDKLPKSVSPNLQRWLATCTVKPVRANNFAWFTAVNQTVRLATPGMEGDERWMLEDLEAMDAMSSRASDGWYSDGLEAPIYDYYSLWVFTSHYLYWRRIIAPRYPKWRERFDARVRRLMAVVPHLFGGNGSHVLMGVSLIYRWAAVTAPVLAYLEGLWPHSPGLLRSIVRRNMEFFWRHGAFDGAAGKLRESLTPDGSNNFRESYIDNGHPYWGMQAFALYLIPRTDPFWTAPEQPLPVEREQFRIRGEGANFSLTGNPGTGEVRWMFPHNGRYARVYRDRYTKFSYSSAFPFQMGHWDGTLAFRDRNSGSMAWRMGVVSGRLTHDGYETEWWTELNGTRINVVSRVSPDGDHERREHLIKAPGLDGVEAVEGSYALPFRSSWSESARSNSRLLIGADSRSVGLLEHEGYEGVRVVETNGAHITSARAAVVTATAPLKPDTTTKLRSVFTAHA